MMAFDTVEELRIIAKDAKLSAVDKAALIKAADEHETCCRQLVLDNQALVDMGAKIVALQAQLSYLRPPQNVAWCTGWVKIR